MSPAADTQHVLTRAAQILSTIASAGNGGIRLIDLSERTGIARPSVHRILTELREIGYASQDENRRYHLGPELTLLGVAAPSPVRNVARIRGIAQDLARVTGDTVYVAMRYFDATRYLIRAEGGYPIRAQTVSEGDVLPLTSTYIGQVFLAQLAPADRHQQIATVYDEPVNEWAETEPAEHERLVRTALAQMDQQGYIYGSDFALPNISGTAMPVPSAHGPAILAMSISGIHRRFPAERERELVGRLREATRVVAQLTDGAK